jgi:hypothetical protein
MRVTIEQFAWVDAFKEMRKRSFSYCYDVIKIGYNIFGVRK